MKSVQKIAQSLPLLFALATAGLWLVPPSLAAEPQRTILVLGDSLSAGYGIRLEDGWVARLERRLDAEHPGWTVYNASISGETTAGGLRRLPALLDAHKPAVVVIELGGNDGLRGQSPAVMADNLKSMAAMSEAAGARVVLVRVALPVNYGPRYANAFQQAYLDAAAEQVELAEFLPLDERVDTAMLQDDGIHPNASAQALMERNVWPAIQQAMRAVPAPAYAN